MPTLLVRREETFCREYSFPDADCILIGRAPHADVCLPDDARRVSRSHAAIVRAPLPGRGYLLRDLGSLRSTRVFGTAVHQHLLREGDLIGIAGYELEYSEAAAAPAELCPLRIVPVRQGPEPGECETRFLTVDHSVMRVPLSEPQRELLDSLLQEMDKGAGVSDLLADMLPAISRACGAARGFSALFHAQRQSGFEVLARHEMAPADQIEVTDTAFLEKLRRGEFVLESRVVLAPVPSCGASGGFVCIDRAGGSAPFQAGDLAFLEAFGRTAARLRSAGLKPRRRSGLLGWGPEMVGTSRAMKDLIREIRQAAGGDGNILLLGESGTGKELVARAIHAAGPYASGPLVAHNCAAVTETLAEAEIFGHAPGAGIAGADPAGAPGWFEQAQGGTLFLDEIHSLSLALQDKFLRVLQDHVVWRVRGRRAVPVQVKVIGATDCDLETAVGDGAFRRPLFYRFSGRLRIPPLRDRKEDIPLLAFYFLDRYAQKSDSPVRTISHRALRNLSRHSWPGNVRELENYIRSAVGRVSDREILFSWDFPEVAGAAEQEAGLTGPQADPQAPTPPRTMAEVEKEKIMEAMEATGGNISKAARLLGYRSRQTMLNKLDRFGISRDFGRPEPVVEGGREEHHGEA